MKKLLVLILACFLISGPVPQETNSSGLIGRLSSVPKQIVSFLEDRSSHHEMQDSNSPDLSQEELEMTEETLNAENVTQSGESRVVGIAEGEEAQDVSPSANASQETQETGDNESPREAKSAKTDIPAEIQHAKTGYADEVQHAKTDIPSETQHAKTDIPTEVQHAKTGYPEEDETPVIPPTPEEPANIAAAVAIAEAYAAEMYHVTIDTTLDFDNSAYRFPAVVPVTAPQETLNAKAINMVDYTFQQMIQAYGKTLEQVQEAGFRCRILIQISGNDLQTYVFYA